MLRDGGLFSIIVSSSFLRRLRRAAPATLKKHAAVHRIVDFGGLPVFANAKTPTSVFRFSPREPTAGRWKSWKVPSLEVEAFNEYVAAHVYTFRRTPLGGGMVAQVGRRGRVFAKVLKAGKPLGEYVDGKMFYGIKTGLNELSSFRAGTTG